MAATKRSLDLAGHRFGRWLVLRKHHAAIDGAVLWLCRCDCGTERPVRASGLRRGESLSCGCLFPKGARSIRHGFTSGGISPTYISWYNMRKRCQVPTNNRFQYYGGRGIKVCAKWQTFIGFLADMGVRPVGKTLDRINTDGNYEPGNCRWATPKEQAANRRKVARNAS